MHIMTGRWRSNNNFKSIPLRRKELRKVRRRLLVKCLVSRSLALGRLPKLALGLESLISEESVLRAQREQLESPHLRKVIYL